MFVGPLDSDENAVGMVCEMLRNGESEKVGLSVGDDDGALVGWKENIGLCVAFAVGCYGDRNITE